MCEWENCWVNPMSVLGEANDLFTGFGKPLFLELAFGVRKAREGLLSQYWHVCCNH